jgi:hypothetical protein
VTSLFPLARLPFNTMYILSIFKIAPNATGNGVTLDVDP